MHGIEARAVSSCYEGHLIDKFRLGVEELMQGVWGRVLSKKTFQNHTPLDHYSKIYDTRSLLRRVSAKFEKY